MRDFLTPGLRVPVAIPFDKPLRLAISSEAPVAGLPQELLIERGSLSRNNYMLDGLRQSLVSRTKMLSFFNSGLRAGANVVGAQSG